MSIITDTEKWLKDIGIDMHVHSYSADYKAAIFVAPDSASIRVWESDKGERRMKIEDCVPYKMYLTLSTGEMQWKHPDTKRILDTVNYYGAMAERHPPF